MKKLKFYEEDMLQLIYNVLACMESETDDLNMYMKKTNAPKDVKADDLFDALDNAMEICKKYNK